jgi:tetratricopeptide (TPR) repeat protein
VKRDQGTAARGYQIKPEWLMAGVLLLVICAYSNSFSAPFLLDNDEIVLQDPRVHTVSALQLQRILTHQYWETASTGLYRPLTTLSYLFNYAVLGNGANPEGYHWINLILHLANVWLVYVLALAVFEQVPIALLAGALWGLHPLHTEVVTNIVGRADLLVTLGVLAAVLCHRKALASTGRRRVLWIAGVFFAVTLGAFAKENGVIAIAAIAIYDLAIGTRFAVRTHIASYLAAAIPCAAYLYARAQVLAGAPHLSDYFCDNPLLGADFWTARATAFTVIAKYFGLLLWPARLSYDYSYNEIPLFGSPGAANATAVAAMIGCAASAVWGLLSWRRRPALFFGFAFFAAAFAPVSNLPIVIGSIMGERFLYTPSIGLALCAAFGLWTVWCKWGGAQYKYAAGGIVAVVLIGYAARAYDRNGDWLDPHRFFRTGVEAAPGSFKTHLNVATSISGLTQEDWDTGIRAAERALAILDPLPDLKNVGRAYRDAAGLCRQAGERLAQGAPAGTVTNGTKPEFWYRKALAALQRSERIELALDENYRQQNARIGKPGLTELPSKLYLEMGRVYMRLKDVGQALSALERGRALEAAPDLLEELAEAYRQAGDPHNAALALDEAYTVDSNRPRVLPRLIEMYRLADPTGCAVTGDASAAALNPDCPMVHSDICAASRNIAGTYVRRGQALEASAVRKRAIEYLGCAPELVK